MGKRLSEQAIEHFHAHGYYAPVPALSAEEGSVCLRQFEAWEARNGGPIGGNDRNKSHLFLKWLDDVVHHRAILDMVEDVIGPNILLWHAQFFVKDAHSPGFISLHQDSAYWEIEPAEGVSAWIAFSDSKADNGAMRVVPDTHKTILTHDERRGPRNMLWRGQTARLGSGVARSVSLELAPGEVSLHNARVVHGSGANHSDRRRVGYSIRYIPTHVKRLGPRDSALLVRGVDEHDNFDPERRPKHDFEPEAVAFHAETSKRYMEQYLSATMERELKAG